MPAPRDPARHIDDPVCTGGACSVGSEPRRRFAPGSEFVVPAYLGSLRIDPQSRAGGKVALVKYVRSVQFQRYHHTSDSVGQQVAPDRDYRPIGFWRDVECCLTGAMIASGAGWSWRFEDFANPISSNRTPESTH